MRKVSFHELDVDLSLLAAPKNPSIEGGKRGYIDGPYPDEWVRITIVNKSFTFDDKEIFDWLENNIDNLWGYSYYYGSGHTRTIVLRFEDKNDALVFKLQTEF